MTPVLFALLLAAGVAFLAIALWSNEGLLGVIAAIFFIVLAYGLFTQGFVERSGTNITTANATSYNGTVTTETFLTTPERTLTSNAIALTLILFAIYLIYIAFSGE